MPVKIEAILEGDLIGTVNLGDSVQITGTYVMLGNFKDNYNFPISTTMIDANYI